MAKQIEAIEQNRKFIIQQQAPAGNFYDVVGLPPHYQYPDAAAKLDEWHSRYNTQAHRLVLREDMVIQIVDVK